MSSRIPRSPSRLMLAIGAAVLVGVGGVVGIAVAGGEDEAQHTAAEPLSATNIGDPEVGRHLFVSKRCSACHSFEGRGGSDAPPLDFMMGRMSATDIAQMSGDIWNHTPAMVRFFKEEDIPFPSFTGSEMADLIAYLHGGGPPPDAQGSHGG
jgi:mono/diheme cytochrome c family protein